MAYIINKSNGNVVTTIADGTVDLTSTSIGLVGRHYAAYGEIINEDLVKMLENFSNISPPSSPLLGQLWYESSSGSLKLNISNNANAPQWVDTTKATVGSNAAATTVVGSLWYDTINDKFNIKTSDTEWKSLKTIKNGEGNGGMSLPSNTDSLNGDVFFAQDDNQLYVYSADTKNGGPGWDAVGIYFSANGTLPGGIKNGEMWFDGSSGQVKVYTEGFVGSAAGSEIVGPVFPRSIPHGLSGLFGVEMYNTPVILEMVNGVPMTITSPTQFINSPPADVNVNGTTITTSMFASTIYKGVNLTIDTSDTFTARFAGPASSIAADIAERFASDVPVQPGDVVKIGGSKDVTKTLTSLDYDVFGVVSTSPAYMMNDGLGDGELFPFIALAGRVPVKVVGPVTKGQRLVSSNMPGVAKAISDTQVASSYVAVFGRALESSDDSGVKLVDAVVGVK